ncbi:leucine-rich repeat extensin-like protein 1 [Melanotaenia boesemani]|uniref:leucine-rich repeat extensin-like protein 1 n=1 Tax=Melanotaenia boesemani TaxID=1250792 RepID=UPI001C0413C7|nr:leucine-rich repeat extensin-like protein 1 [Melanotaenia boesemani]
MPWKNRLSCFAVMVILTLFKLCNGQAVEADTRTPVQGSHHLSSVVSGFKLEPAAQARPGSLTFKFDQQDHLNSTNVLQNVLTAKLKRLDPSVECSSSQMTLTVKRIGTPHFLVDNGEVPLTPLSQMPSTCGFSMKRYRRDVQYAANYQGCNVNKQDDDYVLPLHLWGTPMTMSCPATLPSPSIFCFPSHMVVKLGGVAAKDLKVKMSGMWQPLSMTCSSCGLTFEEFSGELALSAPYNGGPCVEVEDEEHVISLRWGDFELSAACPPVSNTDPIMGTSPPPSDNNQALQHPQYSYFPMFSQFLEPQTSESPAPVAPLPHPQLPFVAADAAENQEVPAAQHPSFPFMPQFPQFFVFPRSDLPKQPSANQNTAPQQVQLPQVSQSPQYQVPFFPQFPMVPAMFPNPAPPTTITEALVTTPSPPTGKEKPQVPIQPQFPVPQYPFLQFHKHPSSPGEKSKVIADPKSVIQQSTPQYLNPQTFQIPVLYPPLNYLSSRQSSHMQAPAPTSAISPAPTEKPASYQPHPFMPVYLFPKQAPMPVFLNPPGMEPSNPASSDQHEHQPIYQAVPPFYSFLPNQRQMALERS